MRYSAGHKEKTRARILDAAAAAFRRDGYHATGVDKVMEDAGLTVGGFYAHFASKDALLAAVLEYCAASGVGRLATGEAESGGQDGAETIVAGYLTSAHRADPERGCPLPSLAAEVSRAGSEPRMAFERLVSGLIARFAKALPPEQADEEAIALAALCIGGMTLARAVQNPEFSDKILTACRAFAHGRLSSSQERRGKHGKHTASGGGDRDGHGHSGRPRRGE
jgi:TetR/AcrR family transcriptional repressor of nem operon